MIRAISQLSSAIDQYARGFEASARTVAQAHAHADQQARRVAEPDDNARVEEDPRQERTEESKSADEPTQSGEPTFEDGIVGLIENENALRATAVVLKAADRTVGSLLNVIA